MSRARAFRFNSADVAIHLPDGPCVIVANHPTLLDAGTMIRCILNMTISVKPSYHRGPLPHPLMDVAGDFDVTSSPSGIPRLIDSAVNRLERRFRIVTLPGAPDHRRADCIPLAVSLLSLRTAQASLSYRC